MRHRKALIGLVTIALALLAVMTAFIEYAGDAPIRIRARISGPSGTETITCWEGRDGGYYLFLPSYAELSQVTLHNSTPAKVFVDDMPLEGKRCESLSLNTPHSLRYLVGPTEETTSLTIVQSAQVPALYLDTASGSMDRIHAKKGNEEAGALRLYTASGALDSMGTLKSISGRGNSTWDWDKKPYSLTLRDAGDLLGMGAAKKWILLANALDATLLRNKIVYDFAREIGLAYSPESRWVDLYLNGEYAGLYLLCERNEIHPQRVDLEKRNSFLVSKDWEWRMEERNQPYVITESGAAFRLRDLYMEESEVLAVLQSVENALLSPEGIDPVTGKHWQELIDLTSWAQKYLIEEVFGNPDGIGLSQYFYYEARDGKLYAGPVWDYDLALGNPISVQPEYPNQIFASRSGVWGSDWYPKLYEKEAFLAEVTAQYASTFRPALEALLEHGIAQYAAQIETAAAIDLFRWRDWQPDDNAQAVQDYMRRRLDFLDELWLEERPFVRLNTQGYDGARSCYYLSPGDLPPKLIDYSYVENVQILGWVYAGTQTPFDPEAPITEDTEITLRYQPIADEEAGEAQPQFPWRYGPAVIFLGMLLILCVIGIRQTKGNGAKEHERRKQHKISP